MVAAIATPRLSYSELEAIALQLPPEERERLALALLQRNCPSTIIQFQGVGRDSTTKKNGRHFPSSGWIQERGRLLCWKVEGKTKSKKLRGLKEERFVRALQDKRLPVQQVLDALALFRGNPDETMLNLQKKGLLSSDVLFLIKEAADVDRRTKELLSGRQQ